MVVDSVENTTQKEELPLVSGQRNNIIENDTGQKSIGSVESDPNQINNIPASNMNNAVVSSSNSVDDCKSSVLSPEHNQLSEKKSTTPAPPRWRFVNEAKKSSGYSSHGGCPVNTGQPWTINMMEATIEQTS